MGRDPGLPVLARPGEDAGFTVARAVLAIGAVRALVPAARPGTALVAAGVTWLLGTGFLCNRYGEVSFRLRDQGNLAVLGFAAVIALLVSRRAAAVNRTRKPGAPDEPGRAGPALPPDT